MTPVHAGDQLDHYRIDRWSPAAAWPPSFAPPIRATAARLRSRFPIPEMEADPVLFDRFQARAGDRQELMDHPGVMKVFADDDRSRLYMVMEWVEGRLLREILTEQKKLPPERAIAIIACGICEALEYIHSHGVVHRDLKPENIMVDADDHIKLIDFGIAGKAGARRLTFAKLSQTHGHARLHFARAGEGQARRRAQRSLCAGRDAVRDADRDKCRFAGRILSRS